jgi:type I restriction enzyme R subunit
VEAKASHNNPADGLQQAKDYAQILGLKWAYSTNGHGIVEFDFTTGKETERTDFPSPSELWARQRSIQKLTSDATAEQFLTPFNLTTAKEPRYYQEIAINAAVRAFLQVRAISTVMAVTFQMRFMELPILNVAWPCAPAPMQ